jgi:glycosyltransferase involved in cell wall biosynthesis
LSDAISPPIAVLAARSRCVVLRQASVDRAQVKLSVVIPNYNTSTFVLAAIESALNQTMKELEVIVVDDGSSDDSVARILSVSDPRLTCVHQTNHGLAAARNTGLAFARGEYVGFLDSDDIWMPLKASRHLAQMESNPDLGLTFSYSEYITEAGASTGQLLISRCANPTARDLALRNHVGNGSTPIARLVCFAIAGGFDETLRNCEDLEMWVRLASRTSFKVQLIPEVLIGYRVRAGSLTLTFDAFLADAKKAVDKCLACGIPGFSEKDARRALAELYRISSRKALSNGQRAVSRKLLISAIQLSPALFARDLRAAGLLGLHVLLLPLPERVGKSLYSGVRVLMRRIYAVVGRAPASVSEA